MFPYREQTLLKLCGPGNVAFWRQMFQDFLLHVLLRREEHTIGIHWESDVDGLIGSDMEGSPVLCHGKA